MSSLEVPAAAEPPETAARRPGYVPIALVGLAALAVLWFGSLAVLPGYSIPSEAGLPTLQVGDHVRALRSGPARGRLVVYKDTIDAMPGLGTFVKRVVAMGGDTVEGRGGVLLVNGKPANEPYLAPGTLTSDFGPQKVPAGQMFVLGDNRENSFDSRYSGPVPTSRVIGRVVFIDWPFTRIGRV